MEPLYANSYGKIKSKKSPQVKKMKKKTGLNPTKRQKKRLAAKRITSRQKEPVRQSQIVQSVMCYAGLSVHFESSAACI